MAARTTQTTDTLSPTIQPSTWLATRTAPTAVPMAITPAVAIRRTSADSTRSLGGAADRNPGDPAAGTVAAASAGSGLGPDRGQVERIPTVRLGDRAGERGVDCGLAWRDLAGHDLACRGNGLAPRRSGRRRRRDMRCAGRAGRACRRRSGARSRRGRLGREIDGGIRLGLIDKWGCGRPRVRVRPDAEGVVEEPSAVVGLVVIVVTCCVGSCGASMLHPNPPGSDPLGPDSVPTHADRYDAARGEV